MSVRSLHRSRFRAKALHRRLETVRQTGIGPTSLSFLPDDQMRPGMDTGIQCYINANIHLSYSVFNFGSKFTSV